MFKVYNPRNMKWRTRMQKKTVADVTADVARLRQWLTGVNLYAEHTYHKHPLGKTGKQLGACKLTAENDAARGWRAARQVAKAKGGGWHPMVAGDYLPGVVAVWAHPEGCGHLFVSTTDGAYYTEAPHFVLKRLVEPPPYFSPKEEAPELGVLDKEGNKVPTLAEMDQDERKAWTIWEYEVNKVVREVLGQVLRSKSVA